MIGDIAQLTNIMCNFRYTVVTGCLSMPPSFINISTATITTSPDIQGMYMYIFAPQDPIYQAIDSVAKLLE